MQPESVPAPSQGVPADGLILAVAEGLFRRGLGPEASRFFARLAVTRGLHEADLQFALLMGQAMLDAEDELHDKAVMDTVWNNLKPLQRAA